MATDKALEQAGLDTLFLQARTYNGWLDQDVGEDIIRKLHDIARWGPTSANCCPLRVVFVRTPEEKEKLKPMLDKGNQDKTMQAPVIALFAYDFKFYDKMGKLAPHVDVEKWYGGKEAYVRETAKLNGTLQSAYYLMAARALGLDCGPMSGFNKQKVKDGFFADLDGEVSWICSMGYGDPATLYPRAARLDFDEACKIV